METARSGLHIRAAVCASLLAVATLLPACATTRTDLDAQPSPLETDYSMPPVRLAPGCDPMHPDTRACAAERDTTWPRQASIGATPETLALAFFGFVAAARSAQDFQRERFWTALGLSLEHPDATQHVVLLEGRQQVLAQDFDWGWHYNIGFFDWSGEQGPLRWVSLALLTPTDPILRRFPAPATPCGFHLGDVEQALVDAGFTPVSAEPHGDKLSNSELMLEFNRDDILAQVAIGKPAGTGPDAAAPGCVQSITVFAGLPRPAAD